MKYTFERLANKILSAMSLEYDGYKINDYEVNFDEGIWFVSARIENGEIIIAEVIESIEHDETRKFTDEEMKQLETLINRQR